MSWLSVMDVSERVEIPPETVRRYINRHSLHLQVKKGHKAYQIAESCLPVFITIRSLYAEGKQADEVEAALARSGRPTIVTVNESGESVNVNVVEALAALDSKMNAIIAMLVNVDERLKVEESQRGAVNEDLKLIREQVMNVHEEMATTTDKFREIQQSQEKTREQLGEIASRMETYGSRRSLWKRLFGR